jgi:hypothetical protein
MSLLTSTDLLTKIPGGVGCAIEIYGTYNNYEKNCKNIDKDYKKIEAIKKDLNSKKNNSIYPNQKQVLEETISRINLKLKDKNVELTQEKTKALRDASMALLQEGANMIMPGAGSMIAGVNSVTSSFFLDDANDPNLYNATRDGIFAGAKDFFLSSGADLLADNCCIQ